MSGKDRTDGAIAGGVEGLADNGVHTILVTSSTHGEGRSSVVARVGRALSSGGGTSPRRTIFWAGCWRRRTKTPAGA